jgi:cytochrome c oxidase assembly factor CtaG
MRVSDALLLAVAALYAAGVLRVARHAGFGRGIRGLDVVAFAAAWLALVVALSPPLGAWSERRQAAHMVQHELLMVVAAPLMALGSPLAVLLWAVPLPTRVRLVAGFQRLRVGAIWRVLTSPPTAFCLYGAALWMWHLPALYDAALAHESIHTVQHLCFFGTAGLFWWGILHGRHGRLGYGAAVVYVFATTMHCGLLGALLTVSPRVWYPPYAVHHPGGLTPLEDQQLAGLLMWIPASMSFVAAGLFLFAEWLRHSDRLSRFKSGPLLGPSHPR